MQQRVQHTVRVSWWTVDGGGATLNASGDYALGVTFGQPHAGRSADGAYTLSGRFWVTRAFSGSAYGIYVPLVQRK